MTRKIVERLEADLKQWAIWLRARSVPASTADQVTNDVLTPFYATDGTIDPGHALLTEARATLHARFADLVRRTGAGVVADLVDGLTSDVIRPMAAGLADVERGLVGSEDAAFGGGHRLLRPNHGRAGLAAAARWCRARFATATNEVLLEDIEQLPRPVPGAHPRHLRHRRDAIGATPDIGRLAGIRRRAGDHVPADRPVRPTVPVRCRTARARSARTVTPR